MSSDSNQREIAAFICSHVYAATHPVLLVAKEQGDWMFLCGGMHYGDNEYHVAGRNHLLDSDSTLHQVLDLDDGWEAERKYVGGPWTRRTIEDQMTIDEIFDSSTRSKGDLAGVFEYEGDTGYFYLYNCGGDVGQQVIDAIHILSGEADFEQKDLTVRRYEAEGKVGLFVRDQLCAVFDIERATKYGGRYSRCMQAHIPPEVLKAFNSQT